MVGALRTRVGTWVLVERRKGKTNLNPKAGSVIFLEPLAHAKKLRLILRLKLRLWLMPINLTWTCGSELPCPIKVKHLRSSVQKMATNQIKKAGAAVEQGKEKLTDEEQLELSMKQLSLLHIKVMCC